MYMKSSKVLLGFNENKVENSCPETGFIRPKFVFQQPRPPITGALYYSRVTFAPKNDQIRIR